MVTLKVNRSLQLPVDKSVLVNAAETALKLSSNLESDLSIVVGSDAFLKKLNQQYRGVDSSTDVLAFTSGEIDPDTSDIYLGDIVISLSRAEEQASLGGHPLGDELQLLVVHGVLHLLGYDHSSTVDKKRMQAAQDNILRTLGLSLRVRL